MSDDKLSLNFLGEQMLRMQADLRAVRAEQIQLESEQSNFRADLKRVEGKVENIGRSVDARFDQGNQTAATNLALTLSAIEKLSAATEARLARVEQTAAENLQTVLQAVEGKRG